MYGGGPGRLVRSSQIFPVAYFGKGGGAGITPLSIYRCVPEVRGHARNMALEISKKQGGRATGHPFAEKSCEFVLLGTADQNPTSVGPGEDVGAWHPPGATWCTTPESGHFGAFLISTTHRSKLKTYFRVPHRNISIFRGGDSHFFDFCQKWHFLKEKP